MNRFFILCLWVPFFPSLTHAQPLDSLRHALQSAQDTGRVEILQRIGFSIVKNNADSAISVFEQSLALALELNYPKGIINAYSGIAYGYEMVNDKSRVIDNYKKAIETAAENQLYNMQGKEYLNLANYYAFTDNAIHALTHYKKALKLFKQEENKDQLISVYMRIGNLYDNQGEYVEALKNNFTALELISAIKDTVALSGVYNNIAIIYKKQNNIDDALVYYHKSQEISKKHNDAWGMAISKVNIALIYKDNHQLDTAKLMLKEALNFFEVENASYPQGQLHHNLGVVYFEGNQLDSALYFLNRSQQLAGKYGFKKIMSKNHIQLAKIHQKKGKYDKALFHIEKSIAIAKAISSTENVEEALAIKHTIYGDKHDISNAYSALKEYQTYHDSLFNSTNSRQIGILKTIFELKEKEKEVALLEKEKEIQGLNEEKKQVLYYLLVSGLFGLGVVSFVLLISRNNKSKANKLLKRQSEEIKLKNEKIELQKSKLINNNEHLKSLNEDKNELIGIVAHDLRSPLNQIKGLVNILKVTLKTDAETEEIIERIDNSMERLRVLVNRTLDLRAIESKKINLNKEVINLGELMHCLLGSYRPVAGEKDIKIIDKLTLDSCYIKVDQNYLIQIIENLLCNAVKFSHKQSKIEILVYREEDKTKLEIIDEGPGLSEEDQKRLFIPFQQLSAKPTNQEKSTGLGLAIVKKYVNAMGGHVFCDSRLGQGAKFTVVFDTVPAPASSLVT
ncbi:ATP-binding protein [Fulvivirgaceae bacterium BMA12]|uniref:histidine kinase n=1 Tax=Agaribacillus aureus TaxID=3051825 RepID=A0ABT8L681_9BACT|nr:ATP-binding protein [Fulvivirgaceae bacterium BMA12]